MLVDSKGNKVNNLLTNQLNIDMSFLIKGYFLVIMEKVEHFTFFQKKLKISDKFDTDECYDLFRDHCYNNQIELSLNNFISFLGYHNNFDVQCNFKIKKAIEIGRAHV